MQQVESTKRTVAGARKNRRWVWFFAVLAVLGVLAISINWVWNASQPFTLEKLQAARELWRRQRPADYDLKVTFARQYRAMDGIRGTMVDKFDVHIRRGQIVEFLVNGKAPDPLLDRDGRPNLAAERAQRENYDISGLFDAIEELIECDRREHRSVFMRARFDPVDGHVLSFTRQFQGMREQHIKVEMTQAIP